MMHQNVSGIHLCVRRAARLLGLLLLIGLHPACYSKAGKTYMNPPALGGATTLFSEDFFPYPNSGWTGPTVSGTTAAQVYMLPFYYLQMNDTSRPGTALTTTTMTFASQPLTFLVDLQFSATTTVADTASILIVDTTVTPVVLAQAVLNANTGMIGFSIAGGATTNVTFSAASIHTVKFQIDAVNNATWSLGGTTALTAAFGAHATKLSLAANYVASAGTAPTFLFGNVIINSP